MVAAKKQAETNNSRELQQPADASTTVGKGKRKDEKKKAHSHIPIADDGDLAVPLDCKSPRELFCKKPLPSLEECEADPTSFFSSAFDIPRFLEAVESRKGTGAQFKGSILWMGSTCTVACEVKRIYLAGIGEHDERILCGEKEDGFKVEYLDELDASCAKEDGPEAERRVGHDARRGAPKGGRNKREKSGRRK